MPVCLAKADTAGMAKALRIQDTRFANFLILLAEAQLRDPKAPLRWLANKTEVSENYLSQVRTRSKNPGDITNRRLEKGMGKPKGWMDIPHSEFDPQDPQEETFLQMVQLLYRESSPEGRKALLTALRQAMKENKRS